MQFRAQHDEQTLAGLGGELHAMHQPVALVDHVEGRHPMRPRLDLVVHVEGLEHAQPVLPDVEPGADLAQLRSGLVHAHGPTAMSQCNRRGQTGQARTGDLRMPGLTLTSDAD